MCSIYPPPSARASPRAPSSPSVRGGAFHSGLGAAAEDPFVWHRKRKDAGKTRAPAHPTRDRQSPPPPPCASIDGRPVFRAKSRAGLHAGPLPQGRRLCSGPAERAAKYSASWLAASFARQLKRAARHVRPLASGRKGAHAPGDRRWQTCVRWWICSVVTRHASAGSPIPGARAETCSDFRPSQDVLTSAAGRNNSCNTPPTSVRSTEKKREQPDTSLCQLGGLPAVGLAARGAPRPAEGAN